MQTAANLGITICVASGDNGYKDDGSRISVDFPSSSPYALAVGGTTLTAPNNIYTSETTWNGSGGGISSFFAKPSYQSAITNSLTKRCSPDVCANADPNTGYIIYIRNKYYVIGGTSAAAPLWAGFLAYINYTGFLNSRIYSLSSSLNDIISGSNGYSATLNYDLCTGLGSPNFTKIKTALGL
jgi:kumamolisin